MPLPPGARFGPYEIVAALGAGGMGEVYRARDSRLNRSVAIKVLPEHAANDIQFRDRFEREARAASALNHPNILTVFDVGRERDADFLVMELIDGVTLRERLADGGLPTREVVHIGAQIADGLAAAHSAGLVHRDLKPDNVMVTRDGRAKILDFGLAKPLDATVAGQHTQTAISHAGMLVGTIGYVAPEQVRGGAATAQSDLFALGVVLYEMTTGQRAFTRATTVETLNAILKEDAPELPVSVPLGLRHIIAHCLEKEPARRFQTAADVAFALRSFASSTTVTVPQAAAEPPRRSRTAWYVAAAAAVLAAVVGAFAGARWLVAPPIDLTAIQLQPFAVESEGEAFPAISPDGRSVAYTRSTPVPELADIVVKSDNAPVPTVLVPNVRYASNLFWSPDGSRLFYQSGARLRSVAAVGGDPREELTYASGAHLSPDGKTLVAFKYNESRKEQLYVGPADAMRPYEPPFIVQTSCSPTVIRFSPEGTKILLWKQCEDNAILILPVPGSDGRGGSARKVFQGKVPDFVFGAQWHPDSRHIVFGSREGLWLGDSESENLMRLTTGTTAAHWPDIGRDGAVAFTEASQDYDLVELPLAGGAPRPLVSSSLYEGGGTWSPTGAAFAYVATRVSGDEIRVRSLTDSSERRLLGAGDSADLPRVARIRALNFSPDGQWLSFTVMSTAPTFHAGIWVMSANGGTARLVTPKEMMAGRASWSSDGKSLMVSMGSGVLNQLWMVPIGGGERRRLATIDGGWIGSAELSPTGESVVAVRYPAGAPAMCVVVDVATGASREFKNFAEPPAYAWAPDGKTVYGIFRTDTVSELRALDVATGTVRAVARYSTIVRLEDDNNVTQRMVFDRGRQSFITMVVNDRSNVWVLKGLTLPTR